MDDDGIRALHDRIAALEAELASARSMIAWLRERQALLGDVVRAARGLCTTHTTETQSTLAAALEALDAREG